MRKFKIGLGEYYHVYNRGNNKQPIFLDYRDWVRFLFLVFYLQSSCVFYNLGRQVAYFVRHSVFNMDDEDKKEIKDKKITEIVAFCLMPNHFHLILREVKEGGISQYMQRLLNSYTKYFNTKYKRFGHLFQGPFQYVHVADNDQLLYLSTYIHRNPKDLEESFIEGRQYLFSSLQDYIGDNRWEDLLAREIILSQFDESNNYASFVEESTAKLPKETDSIIEGEEEIC